jgi:putative ABC transport system permease protein
MRDQIDRFRQDLADGLRNVRRYPVAALVAVLSLAAGIGGATITLTVRDAVFRRPPPTYRQPSELSRVQVGRPDDPIRPAGGDVPAGLYVTWVPSFGPRLGATGPTLTCEVRAGDRTVTIATRAATPSLFAVLGVEPALGRTFTTASDVATPALLSHRVWQELFDGRLDVVGQPLWIDNRPFVVSGVMPERFWFDDTDSPIWTPLDVDRLAPDVPLQVVARRPRATTPAALEAALRSGLDAYARRQPAGRRQFALAVSGVEGTPLGRHVSIALPYVLSAAVLLTLLIACANVAVLLIAQWTAREHEIAIRAAIGASRWRLVRSLLTESTAIAAAGGGLGVATVLGLRAIVVHLGGDSLFYDLSISPWTFASTALVVLFAGIAAGLLPALHGTRTVQGNPFRVIAGSVRAPQRWRHALVVLEIAVTVALLVVTSALLDGYRRWIRPSMGFETRPLVAAGVENPAGVPVTRLLEAARALPGVQSAAASTAVPLNRRGAAVRVAATRGEEGIPAELSAISPSFFSALGVPLRAGRPFADGEPEAGRTAILCEGLAARLFPGRQALGAAVWVGGVPYDVVGIVADYSDRPLQPAHTRARVYTPLPASVTQVSLLVRASEVSAVVRPLRRHLRGAAPGNVEDGVYTLDQIISAGGQEILAGTAPLVPLIAIGLLLTAAGVYGVLAFAVASRARELAVRVAVGASGRDLVRLVTMQTLALVGAGLGLGIGATFALSRVLRAAGGAGSVFDPEPVAFAVPVAVVAVLAVAAAWLPARRAGAIDPVVLLRTS